jgi:hypothetical protein
VGQAGGLAGGLSGGLAGGLSGGLTGGLAVGLGGYGLSHSCWLEILKHNEAKAGIKRSRKQLFPYLSN